MARNKYKEAYGEGGIFIPPDPYPEYERKQI